MAWPAGPELAGFAAAPWGRRAWNRERTSGPLLSGPALQTPRAEQPHRRAERAGRRRLQSPQQVRRPEPHPGAPPPERAGDTFVPAPPQVTSLHAPFPRSRQPAGREVS